MRKLTTIETILFNAVLSASPNWISQISYDTVGSSITPTNAIRLGSTNKL